MFPFLSFFLSVWRGTSKVLAGLKCRHINKEKYLSCVNCNIWILVKISNLMLQTLRVSTMNVNAMFLYYRKQKRESSSSPSLQSFICNWWGSCMTHRPTKTSRLMTGRTNSGLSHTPVITCLFFLSYLLGHHCTNTHTAWIRSLSLSHSHNASVAGAQI